MFTKDEIISLFISILILGFVISLIASWSAFLYACLFIFLILMINVLAKKITSYYLDSEIRIKIWEFQRYGFRPHQHLKKPFPIGIFLPIIMKVLTMGVFNWIITLTFDVKAKAYRAAKRHGKFAFAEMSDFHLALIAIFGIIANLIFGVIGYLIGFPDFAKLNFYFAFLSMIPLSDLDGTKIFFGSKWSWIILTLISAVAAMFAFVL